MVLNHNYRSVPSKEKLQAWYDDNERILERMWKFSVLQDYNQRMTLSFLDGWVTCIGWIITDHWNSCYTVSSVYEFVKDGWVTYIGWITTDHQSSCYTISSVYEWAIKEGLCYWGSKTLLREIWNGEGWCQRWTHVEKTYRSWTHGIALTDFIWKELDKTFLALLLFSSWITGKLNSNLKPRSLVNEDEGEIWSIWSPVRNVKGDVRAHAWNKFSKWRPC